MIALKKIFLLEKEETDIKFRQEAMVLFDKLTIWLREDKDLMHQRLTKGPMKGSLVLPVDVVDKQYEDLFIIFSSRANLISRGAEASFGVTPSSKVPYIILPYLNDKGNFDDSSLNKFRTGRFSFLHEFIHYLDSRRWKGDFVKYQNRVVTPDSVTDKEYYNRPIEYNAYYQQAIGKFGDALKQAKQLGHECRLPDNVNDFARNIKQLFFDKRMLKNLNPKLERNLNKRLADLYMYLKQNM